jgi:sarcosine oxidase subunit gamma
MADPRTADPTVRSPLARITAAAAEPIAGAPVTLRELPLRGLVDLRLDPANAAARQAAEGAIGATLPVEPNRSSAGTGRCTALWLGPDEFLVVTDAGEESVVAERLHRALAAHHAAITEVSDGRTTLEIAGARARDLIAKGCGLDLHPRVFGPGHCAQSGLAKARVLIHQIDAKPTFEVLVERSHAEYLFRWLQDAMREFESAQG